MNRLTLDEAIEHLAESISTNDFVCEECKQEHIQLQEWLEELREYKQIEEHDLLVRLPCKIGDTVYVIGVLGNSEIEEYEIIYIRYAERKNRERNKDLYFEAVLKKYNDKQLASIGFNDEQLNKTVFLTKEEAEKKLDEVKNENL